MTYCFFWDPNTSRKVAPSPLGSVMVRFLPKICFRRKTHPWHPSGGGTQPTRRNPAGSLCIPNAPPFCRPAPSGPGGTFHSHSGPWGMEGGGGSSPPNPSILRTMNPPVPPQALETNDPEMIGLVLEATKQRCSWATPGPPAPSGAPDRRPTSGPSHRSCRVTTSWGGVCTKTPPTRVSLYSLRRVNPPSEGPGWGTPRRRGSGAMSTRCGTTSPRTCRPPSGPPTLQGPPPWTSPRLPFRRSDGRTSLVSAGCGATKKVDEHFFGLLSLR